MTQLTINIPQGSLSFNFTPDGAKQLQQEISNLMQSLKASATRDPNSGSRPQPQKSMEYRYTGEIFLEIFCNPNIYPSPFAAKILLTMRDERIRITTEVELTQLVDDLNSYLERV
ncbi:hypothetical protein [Myxosarcina sp. GI1]|uniref:hypothetical protein n=1 Tax=Myxosarcina sp. GI1 TaxID=1541065 RepID=UPI00055C300F|nr:hypothetical protein [Myxosarcina sp. GI1]